MKGEDRPRDNRRTTGKGGEDLAAQYLERKGCRILDRNWRCRIGEIDLVVRDGDTIAIVEVRTKRGSKFGSGIESVTPKKLERLRRLTLLYLQHKKLREVPVRLDVIDIAVLPDGTSRIVHVPNAVVF